MILTQQQANSLIDYVENALATSPCSHQLHFASEWGKQNGLDWEDLEDLLHEHGCGCDCEVVLNLPDDGDLEVESTTLPQGENPFWISSFFKADLNKVYTKALFTSEDMDYNKYTAPGELLIPAPSNATPKKKVRKGDWFFVSVQSELPNQLGFVHSIPPTTAAEFAARVRAYNLPTLAHFDTTVAAFYLERISQIEEGKGMFCFYLERNGVGGPSVELKMVKAVR